MRSLWIWLVLAFVLAPLTERASAVTSDPGEEMAVQEIIEATGSGSYRPRLVPVGKSNQEIFLGCERRSSLLAVDDLIRFEEGQQARRVFLYLQAEGLCGTHVFPEAQQRQIEAQIEENGRQPTYVYLTDDDTGKKFLYFFWPLLPPSWLAGD